MYKSFAFLRDKDRTTTNNWNGKTANTNVCAMFNCFSAQKIELLCRFTITGEVGSGGVSYSSPFLTFFETGCQGIRSLVGLFRECHVSPCHSGRIHALQIRSLYSYSDFYHMHSHISMLHSGMELAGLRLGPVLTHLYLLYVCTNALAHLSYVKSTISLKCLKTVD